MVDSVTTGRRSELEDDLTRLVKWVEDAEESSDGARRRSERDRDYYDNKQLTDEEVKELKKRKQPPIVINRIKRKVDFLNGLEQRQRTDPKAFPRNPNVDEEAAEAATDSIRFVVDNNDFDRIRSAVWENMLIEGMGGCEVGIEMKQRGAEIFIKFWSWDRIGYDPHSASPDFSDGRYTYGLMWMDFDLATEKWPDKVDVLETTRNSDSTAFGDTYDDKPRFWIDSKRKRIRIAHMYYKRSGNWFWCTFTKGGKIRDGVVPYVNDDGESFNPMTLASAYVDRENCRYGVVREMIDPQDEINKRRSKTLHRATMRQVVAEQGAVDDPRKAQQELAKPDGFVEITPMMRFDIQPNPDQTQTEVLLLQEAKNEIDLMGPNASMTGKSEKTESGRAIIAQQQGGFIEISPLLDRLRQFNKQVYEKIWYLIKQFWTEERWVRVTDNENNVKFVGLNRPMTVLEQAQEELGRMGVSPEEIAREAQLLQGDPRVSMIGGVRNAVAEIDVDIKLEDVPDVVTIQQEQFDQLIGLAQAGITFPPEIYIRASQLRNKDELIEALQGQGQSDPGAQQLRDIAVGAEIEEKVAQTDKLKADALLKTAQAAKTAREGVL